MMGAGMRQLVDNSMVSFGAGVNSTALVIWLVNQGWRGPIVFADTGCEHPGTYCFMNYFEREWLEPLGLEITRLQGNDKGESLIDYCERLSIIPFATMRWCTRIFKVEPLNAYAQAAGVTTQYIGIAADEAHRQKGRNCPLVEEGIDRRGCIEIIESEGLSVPQKSGCYICPFQRDGQWRELYRLHRDLYERAARMEEVASAKSRNHITLDPSGLVTLRQRQERYDAQLPLIDDATMDDLRAYQPCMCGL